MDIVSVRHLFVLATNGGFILSCQLNGHKVKARNRLFAAKQTPKILEKKILQLFNRQLIFCSPKLRQQRF